MMSTQVTLTLPDEIYRRAEWLAQLTSRDVTDILSATIELSLPAINAGAKQAVRPMAELSDAEVLALTDLQMEAAQDQRLSQLLDRQQAGELTDTDRAVLVGLMQGYQEGLLRKAQALQEAVRRGLREPLG
jgi:predicted transcriptional regulator